jgi:hypothetical protein
MEEGVRRALAAAAALALGCALSAICAALPVREAEARPQGVAAPAARARPAGKARAKKRAKGGVDPAHWFATRAGLIRVYQERKARPAGEEGATLAGISCEVIESRPAEPEAAARTRELCTVIVGMKPKPATQLVYELRESGIFMVSAEAEGDKPRAAERLLLPGPVRPGAGWRESRGKSVFDRRIKSAGAPCKAAGFKFGDCLVVSVVLRKGARVSKKYLETYAAGVGLVEDAQWQLIDLKGL